MVGKASDIEKAMFRAAFNYLERHCNPPANQSENAVNWWIAAADDAATLYEEWKKYPLMCDLLIALYGYIETKAIQNTKELAEFAQE